MKGLGLSVGENEWKPLDLLENEQILTKDHREAVIH